MDPEHERQAIEAAKAEPSRFAVLYEAYFADIFRFLYRRANHRDLTADLTQQTFLKAMLALPKYEPRGLPFRAWLYRIALNEIRMYWRKKKEVVLELGVLEVRTLGQEIGIDEGDEDRRRLAIALGKLSEEQARLIELRYFDGLSFAELGQVLGIGEDAAKMRTHRVLNGMRNYLGPRA
jgi:RNA polymerase sigma-70 factor (ECF subfamily)